jgi:GMP synthase (glutamine-hydrolysing)
VHELGLGAGSDTQRQFGVGLAIRCAGEISREKLDSLRLADQNFIEEIRRAAQQTNKLTSRSSR